jgi:DNA-binding transcriptional LysR family regulator
MKLTQLDGLVAFVTVAQKRSFTAAAAALEVTPPAVSQAVKQLEARLGAALFNRTTRTVGLTEAGARYFARVAPAVRELDDASTELRRDGGSASGLLRITAPAVLYPTLLRPVLPSFFLSHPAVQVEMSLNDGFIDIVEGGFDAGIRLGDSVQRDMVAVPLTGVERTCIVASPDYIARRGMPRRLESLRDHDCVRYRFPSSGAIYRWELVDDGRPVDVKVEGPLTVSDSLSMAQAALDGIGLAYTFERQVAADIAAGRLVPVLQAHWPRMPGFHLYYPHRRQVPPKLRVFIDHARASLAAVSPRGRRRRVE